MGEFAIRNVPCKANRDSQRDSGQKRRKHVGSPQFAESCVLTESPVNCFFRIKKRRPLLVFLPVDYWILTVAFACVGIPLTSITSGWFPVGAVAGMKMLICIAPESSPGAPPE